MLFRSEVAIPIRQIMMQYGITTGAARRASFQRAVVTYGSISSAGSATSTVISARRKVSQITIVENFRRAESCPSFSRVWEIIGIRAVPSAPSPRMRRKRFGSVNASAHALISIPPPMNCAVRISRTSPKTRLRKVAPESPIVLLKTP